jgi:hypothetical protein
MLGVPKNNARRLPDTASKTRARTNVERQIITGDFPFRERSHDANEVAFDNELRLPSSISISREVSCA